LSSRHCEELKNAYGPPDGVPGSRSRAVPKGPRSPRGEPREPPQSLQGEGTGPDGSSKAWTLSSNDESSKKSSSPGCPWQGRAGRLSPHPATEAQARLDSPAKRQIFLSTLCLRAFAPLRLFSKNRVPRQSKHRHEPRPSAMRPQAPAHPALLRQATCPAVFWREAAKARRRKGQRALRGGAVGGYFLSNPSLRSRAVRPLSQSSMPTTRHSSRPLAS